MGGMAFPSTIGTGKRTIFGSSLKGGLLVDKRAGNGKPRLTALRTSGELDEERLGPRIDESQF